MKRRIGVVLVTAAALTTVTGVAPAYADFHGFCTAGTSPTAYVGLNLSGSTLTYSGLVRCDGTGVSIDSLSFRGVDANGETAPPPVTAACAAPCGGAVTVSGTYTVPSPGTYSVKMAF